MRFVGQPGLELSHIVGFDGVQISVLDSADNTAITNTAAIIIIANVFLVAWYPLCFRCSHLRDKETSAQASHFCKPLSVTTLGYHDYLKNNINDYE